MYLLQLTISKLNAGTGQLEKTESLMQCNLYIKKEFSYFMGTINSIDEKDLKKCNPGGNRTFNFPLLFNYCIISSDVAVA